MTQSMATHPKEIEVDVLVIGGGGTGLAAAVSASEAGATVLVAEKSGSLGGTTALSIGSVTAGCTSYQERQGIHDSPEALFEDMTKFNAELEPYDNHELRWVLARESGNTIDWLRSLGFEFFGPSLEPPNRVPRMHNVIPNSWSYPFLLQRAAAKRGVSFLLNAPARKLIQERRRITGAILETGKTSSLLRVHARRAVILACGDFSANEAMKSRYLSADLARVPPYNPNSQGEGHLMGEEVGGHLVNMEVLRKPSVRFVAAPKRFWHELLPSYPFLIKFYALGSHWLPRQIFERLANSILTTHGAPVGGLYKEGAILVNQEGKRFTNEVQEPAIPISKQPGGRAYILFDSQVAEKFSFWPNYISTAPGIAYAYIQDYERTHPDIVSKGKSWGEAAKIHPRPKMVIQTVERYNRSVEAGRDEAYQRSPLGEGINKPPFYVMGPVESYLSVTKGGLDIDTHFQVLDSRGKVIPGLFAGGGNGGGLVLLGHGMGLAWAFTSGRLAGVKAAQST